MIQQFQCLNFNLTTFIDCSQFKVVAAYLDPFFFQVHLQCQLFPEHHVRIVSLFESRFQLFQLFFGEYGPMSSLSLSRWTRKYGPRAIMMTASGSVARHGHGHHVTRIYALIASRSDWKNTVNGYEMVIIIMPSTWQATNFDNRLNEYDIT